MQHKQKAMQPNCKNTTNRRKVTLDRHTQKNLSSRTTLSRSQRLKRDVEIKMRRGDDCTVMQDDYKETQKQPKSDTTTLKIRKDWEPGTEVNRLQSVAINK